MMWITRRLSAETKCSSRSAGEAEYVTVRINKIDPGWAARAPAPNKRHEHTNFKETKSKATPAQPNTRSPTNTRLFQWSTQKSSYASRLTPRAPVLLWRNSGAIKTRIWTNSFRSVKLYVTQAPQRAHVWVWNSRKEQELLSAYLCFVLRFSFIWGNRAGNSRRRSVPSPADVVPSAALCCANKKFFRAWNCESIFFFLFFLFVGVGRGEEGEERSAGATQSLRTSSKSAHKHEIARGCLVSDADISWLHFSSRVNFSLQTQNFYWLVRGWIHEPTSLVHSALWVLVKENPGGWWPLTPVNPAPHIAFALSAGTRPSTTWPHTSTLITTQYHCLLLGFKPTTQRASEPSQSLVPFPTLWEHAAVASLASFPDWTLTHFPILPPPLPSCPFWLNSSSPYVWSGETCQRESRRVNCGRNIWRVSSLMEDRFCIVTQKGSIWCSHYDVCGLR